MEEKIYELKSLIEDYEEEKRELRSMINAWEKHDDPGSDPGLQYEQECKVEDAYNKIKALAATL